MNRFEIRQEVRRLIRDETYPKRDIDEAINRVIRYINTLHRMRFHQGISDITLVTDDFTYAIPTILIAEEVLVFDPPVSPKPATEPSPQILHRS